MVDLKSSWLAAGFGAGSLCYNFANNGCSNVAAGKYRASLNYFTYGWVAFEFAYRDQWSFILICNNTHNLFAYLFSLK